jgi:hypothetical protein
VKALTANALRVFIAGFALVVATPTLAAGQTAPKLSGPRTACDAMVGRRLNDLARTNTEVDAAPHLTGPDRSKLDSILTATTTGLMSLKTKIDADDTPVALRTDCRTIVTGYRVYLMVNPQARLVVAADRALAAANALSELANLLQARVARDVAAGKDVSKAKADVIQLTTQAQAAHAAASGVPAGVLALTPAGYPGNRPTLVAARATLATTRGELVAATEAGRRAVAALRAGSR